MAENEANNQEEVKKELPKKKFPLKILILVVVFLFLFGGGVFVWKGNLLAGFLSKDEAGIEEIEEGYGNAKPDIGPVYELNTFIVNLAGTHGKRYLKSKVELELSAEEAKPEMERRLPQIRDNVLTLLSSKTYEDINTLEGKFQLRAEIMSVLNQHLTTGQITNVYFTEFIVQ
jgi:flagellar FliL protein